MKRNVGKDEGKDPAGKKKEKEKEKNTKKNRKIGRTKKQTGGRERESCRASHPIPLRSHLSFLCSTSPHLGVLNAPLQLGVRPQTLLSTIEKYQVRILIKTTRVQLHKIV